jgi:predicted nucleotidyltransferase
MNDSAHENMIAQARALLAQEPRLLLAFVFGSTVNHSRRADSDVDIAVLFDQPLNSVEKQRLAEHLTLNMAYPVDLIDLRHANGVILQQILRTGRKIIDNAPLEYVRLLSRMIFNQADMMPYYHRVLKERREAFLHG